MAAVPPFLSGERRGPDLRQADAKGPTKFCRWGHAGGGRDLCPEGPGDGAARKGQANVALIDLLASEWGIAKSQMRILAVTRNRNKIVLITGNPEALLAQLNERGG